MKQKRFLFFRHDERKVSGFTRAHFFIRSLSFFALGFFSLLSQTLILREFIISFGGNELGIGLFYFFWLFWVGAGAFWAVRLQGQWLQKHFFRLLFFYSVFSVVEIILCMGLRELAGVNWWEFFSLEKVVVYLFVLTALISFLTGILFTAGAAWVKQAREENTSSVVARAYIFEALGSFAAGIIATVLISRLVLPLAILFGGVIVFSAIAFFQAFFLKERTAMALHGFVFIVSLLLVGHQVSLLKFSHNVRFRSSLPAAATAAEVYTPYQHLILKKLPSQLVVFADGEIISTIPEPRDADKAVALFVAQAGLPQRVLIFGYGVENIIASFLSFPVQTITYCLEDKVYFQSVEKNLPAALKEKIHDPRVRVVFEPPRNFLKNNTGIFDLIIVSTADPHNLFVNALFTRDFYVSAWRHLSGKGVFATRLSSAEDFIGEEIRNYGSSVYYTLKSVFPRIVISPGDTNWFFAGTADSLLSEDPAVLEERFKQIVPSDYSFSPAGFYTIFPEKRVKLIKKIYQENTLFDGGRLINQDRRPLTFFLNLLVLARYTNSFWVNFFKQAFTGGLFVFIIPFFILFAVRVHFLMHIENIKSKRLIFNVKLFQIFSGFLGFSFHLVLIFFFQNCFGFIFQYIGFVNALFMLGLCLGGIAGKKALTLLRRFSFHAGLRFIVFVLLAEGVVIAGSYFLSFQMFSSPLVFMLFAVFFILSGVLTGISYPLCARIFEDNEIALMPTAGILEFLDHWGGSFAGLLTGILMLPLLGVAKTLFILLLIIGILIGLFVMELIPWNIFGREKKIGLLSFPFIRTSYVMASAALIFLCISFGIQHKQKLTGRQPVLETISGSEGSKEAAPLYQKSPFPAVVYGEGENKEFSIETKNFASHIKGFGGPINASVRLSAHGEIKSIQVISHNETPGYTAGMETFLRQFNGKSLYDHFSLDRIDAISGATITSRAFVDTINESLRQVREALRGNDFPPDSFTRTKVVLDPLAGYAFIVIAMGIAFYIWAPRFLWLRRFYLLLSVIVFGVLCNYVFSLFHLACLMRFDFFSSGLLSQIFLCVSLLVLAVCLGQVWCGWMCPFGALQELLGKTRLNRTISAALDKKLRYSKYVLLAVFVIVVSLGGISMCRYDPLSVFFSGGLKFSVDKILAVLVLFFSVFFLRFWCRYFCICGAFWALFNKIALFKKYFIKEYKNCPLGVQGAADVDCLQCNLCLQMSHQEKMKQSRQTKNGDRFFAAAFLVILLVMGGLALSAIKHKSVVSLEQKQPRGASLLTQSSAGEKIRRLIDENKLSDKEALFYKRLEEK